MGIDGCRRILYCICISLGLGAKRREQFVVVKQCYKILGLSEVAAQLLHESLCFAAHTFCFWYRFGDNALGLFKCSVVIGYAEIWVRSSQAANIVGDGKHLNLQGILDALELGGKLLGIR